MDNTKLNSYVDYILEQLKAIIAIDSPTGYTENAAKAVAEELTRLGYAPERTVKGGVTVDLGGKPENGILIETHLDTLGAMVSAIKGNGRLMMVPLGGLCASNIETEDVRVVTRSGKIVCGTVQLANASVHVNGNVRSAVRDFNNIEVVLDEDVSSASDAKALGIRVGDIVCVEPRLKITDTGYIKSRFLDDKLSVAILLGYAKYLKDEGITPDRRVYGHITVYEEIGHGGSASVPAGVTEGLSVDMGCVGDGLACTERQVSICAKDSGGPYNYEVVGNLIKAAEETGADYAVDIYPSYGSDVEATLRAGWDIKHGLIGAGVYASHGYERSHKEGVLNTLKVLIGYIG